VGDRVTDRPSAKHVAEYVGARALGAVLRRLPADAASALTGAAFAALMPRTSRHRRALDHLALALPEVPAAEREAIARRMWRHLGRVAGEAFFVDRLVRDDARMALPDDFAAIAERAKDGVVIAGLHLGNWEVAGSIARHAGLPIAGVYQELHNPLAEGYLRRMRGAVFPAGLYGKGPDLGRTLIRLARTGHAVGIVADLREKRGLGVLFFGEPAYATPLPALLARLTGRPLVVSTAIRTRGARFRALLEEVPVARTADRDADVAAATQAVHAVYERWIRAHPDQWLWTHRKWARSAHRELVVAAGARAAAREPAAPTPADR
jgi:Kdo2-lipid IVA lauroyltransferase/acyltransferase